MSRRNWMMLSGGLGASRNIRRAVTLGAVVATVAGGTLLSTAPVQAASGNLGNCLGAGGVMNAGGYITAPYIY